MKIGIVGGGAAGLLAAWLLEEDHDVTLYERDNRLGGHAHTVSIPLGDEIVSVEAGFEFFSNALFPHLNRLLAILSVPKQPYPMRYCFQDVEKGRIITLPPIHPHKVAWKSFFPSSLSLLAQFGIVLKKSYSLVKEKDTSITLEELANSAWVSKEFKERFFYPLYAGAWGFSIEDAKNFAAYDMLKWSLYNAPSGLKPTYWYDMVNGMVSYIEALTQDIKKTTIHRGTRVDTITYNGSTYTLMPDKGPQSEVDCLIIATNAYCARSLLKDIPHTHQLATILGGIDYVHTHIAIHGDRSFMPENPKDWSTVNVHFDGEKSCMTSYKTWKNGAPIYRSWLSTANCFPRDIYCVQDYWHAKVTPRYFQTQERIKLYQGEHNLWLAGIYTHDIDSHESALVSAIKIAKALVPLSRRLALLTDPQIA